MKKAALLGTILILTPPAAASAQHEATLGVSVINPRGEFGRNTDNGFGFVGSYLYSPVPNRAIGFGFTGTFQSYGNTSRRAPLSSTIPDIAVDVETSNETAFIQGLVQIKPFQGVIQPYLRGNAGWGWFFTRTSIEDPLTNVTILSDTNQSDGTWIWGGGGGFQIRVYQGQPRPGFQGGRLRQGAREPVRAFIDLGATYMAGNTVQYLQEGSLVTEEGEVDIDRRLVESDIELVQYLIGVSIEF